MRPMKVVVIMAYAVWAVLLVVACSCKGAHYYWTSPTVGTKVSIAARSEMQVDTSG